MNLGRKPLKKRKRRPEEAVPHSVNHPIRIEALAIFHEGEFSAGEVADMIGEDVKKVRGHVMDLYESGCIEFVGYREAGNHKKPLYRAIVLPVVTDEVACTLSADERHDISGAIVQGFQAETLSSYRNRKLDKNPVCLLWDAPYVDAQGQQELHDLMLSSWKEVLDIHGRSTNRMAVSGETGTTTVVGLMCFERGRPGRPEGGYFMTELHDRK